MQHRHELITFEGSNGNLSATLHIPDGELRGAALFAHCFTCSRSLKTTVRMSSGIEEGGFAVLRFDFTGLGESEGEFSETSVTTNIADLEAAANYLEGRGFGPCVMVGHSLGGAATLLAAGNLPSVRAVVAIAAPFRPDHVRHIFSESELEKVAMRGRAKVTIAGRPFDISHSFFEDLEKHCAPEKIRDLRRPLLVVHGTADSVVGIEEGEHIYGAAEQPKWFAAVPDADHLFMNGDVIASATQIIRTFLDVVI